MLLQDARQVFFLALIITLVGWVYNPGLSGGFLFDDYPNLEYLGYMGGVVDWETLRSYVTTGIAGPTGRPVALASFLLDDNTWPSHAPWFKKTNLLVHILCGLLLCWATLLLIRNFKSVTESQAQWIAVLACAFWLLHPYMVSTTLYVVQRMAQLATLFCLVGIVLYLHARLQLSRHPKRAYVLMAFAVGAGTVLSTFSKENGALLPLLILIIELCLPKDGKPDWRWRAVFLWLPSIAIFVLLARYINLSDNPWPNRNFNQIERLLTEARIVCEYLFHLFVPRIEGNGLYQDGYVISKGVFEPATTFFAILFIFALVVLAFLLRNKHPLVTLAILFFFSAHLMESTVVGLELYFEHRNHLAALFLFLPLAYCFVVLAGRMKFMLAIVAVMIFVLASMTWLRASLWADNKLLELHWIQSATDSPRAVNSMVDFYISNGLYDKAGRYLETESERLHASPLLTVRTLLHKIYTGAAVEQDFVDAGERLKAQGSDGQSIKGVRAAIELVISGGNEEYARYSFVFLDALAEKSVDNNFLLSSRLLHYLRGKLYLHLDQPEKAYCQYSRSMRYYNETDAALAMVAEFGAAGYPVEAVVLLNQAGEILQQQGRTLKRSRTVYEQEIERLKRILEEDIVTKKLDVNRI